MCQDRGGKRGERGKREERRGEKKREIAACLPFNAISVLLPGWAEGRGEGREKKEGREGKGGKKRRVRVFPAGRCSLLRTNKIRTREKKGGERKGKKGGRVQKRKEKGNALTD